MKHKTFMWFKDRQKIYYNITLFNNGKIIMPKDMERDIIELIMIIANKRKDMLGHKYDRDEVVSMLWLKTVSILFDLKQRKGNIKTFLSTCYENYIKNLSKKKVWDCPISNWNYDKDNDETAEEHFEGLIYEKARNTDK